MCPRVAEQKGEEIVCFQRLRPIALLALMLLGSILPVALSAPPVAYMHIGPHKTGTTHFQGVAVQLAGILAKEKLSVWPNLADPNESCTIRHGHSKMMRHSPLLLTARGRVHL